MTSATRRRLRRRRSRRFWPPQMPSSWSVSRAQLRQWSMTGHPLHTSLAASACRASAFEVASGKNSSGSTSRQDASSIHIMRWPLSLRGAGRRDGRPTPRPAGTDPTRSTLGRAGYAPRNRRFPAGDAQAARTGWRRGRRAAGRAGVRRSGGQAVRA